MVIPIWVFMLAVIIVLVNASATLLAVLFIAAGAGVAGFCFGFLKGYERAKLEAKPAQAKPKAPPKEDPLADVFRRAEEQVRQARAQAAPHKAPLASHWKTLGLKPGASEEEINDRYRELARKAHPDTGGSEKAMLKLNLARDLARREARQRSTT